MHMLRRVNNNMQIPCLSSHRLLVNNMCLPGLIIYRLKPPPSITLSLVQIYLSKSMEGKRLGQMSLRSPCCGGFNSLLCCNLANYGLPQIMGALEPSISGRVWI